MTDRGLRKVKRSIKGRVKEKEKKTEKKRGGHFII